MGLRIRNQHWHYRFYAAGRRWTGGTGLAATARNRNAALLKEAEARQLVTEGHGDQLDRTIKPFSDAADQFITWAKGARGQTPGSGCASMASLREFFGNRPVHSLTAGQLQDYMSWRRAGDDKAEIAPVKEITLRHDLHALSLLFQYGGKHNWCARNPVEEVKIPSDKDAQRIHVISVIEEEKYFGACVAMEHEYQAKAAQTKRNACCRPVGWLFAGKSSSMPLKSVENAHQKALARAGLSFVLYDFRHTCATRWAERGMGVETIARLLGHANLRTLMRYVHLSQEHLDRSMVLYGVEPSEPARVQSGSQ